MGVFIPDMQKPERCVDCAFCVKYKQSGTYCNLLEADINTNVARQGHSLGFPLVEINIAWGSKDFRQSRI